MVWVVLVVIVAAVILVIVLALRSTLTEVGKECNKQEDCARGLVCSAEGGTTVCKQGLGQTCGANNDCSVGLVCSPTLKVCVAAPAVPAPVAETRTLPPPQSLAQQIPPQQIPPQQIPPQQIPPPALVPIERNPKPLLSRPLPVLPEKPPLPTQVVTERVPAPALVPAVPVTVIKEVKSVKATVNCKSDASSYVFSAQTGCSRFNVASDASSEGDSLPPIDKDFPTVVTISEAKSEGKRIIEIEGLIDACNFSDRIIYIKKNSVFKLPAGVAIDQSAGINTHSYAEHVGSLKDITVIRSFNGFLYTVAQGYLYCLNMRTYSARKWQWIQCSWAPNDIDALSVPYDDSLLWIHTKDDKAFLYRSEKLTKLEDNCRRIYGINAETYLSFGEKEMVAYPGKRSFALVKDALLLHDSSIVILQERDSAYRRLCLLDWKAYHIRV